MYLTASAVKDAKAKGDKTRHCLCIQLHYVTTVIETD